MKRTLFSPLNYCWMKAYRCGPGPKYNRVCGCTGGWVVRLAAVGYLRGMKLTRTNLWLAAATAMLLTASCAQAPDAAEAEKDPSADAAYKRAHRAEGYREAQRSNVTRN
ncbi:hypothetical protein GCM10027044_33510 [Hymenobacter ruber]